MKISDGPSYREGSAVNNPSAALPHKPSAAGINEKGRPDGKIRPDPAAALIDLLKLPRDQVSRTVLSLARFFSLPMDPKLLSSLRKAALGPLGQAAALGTAAAAAKGVQLSGRALLEYAAAIEGTVLLEQPGPEGVAGQKRAGDHRTEEGQGREHPPEQDSQGAEDRRFDGGGEEGRGHHGGSRGGGHGGEGRTRGDPAPPDAEGVRRRVTAVLAEKPLLDALNRLPGKTRRRWILLPFSFIAGKLEFTVSLRLFLNPHPGVSGKAAFPERLCADLKVSVPPGSSSGERSRRWVIVLERTEAEGAAPQIRAELSLFKAPGKEGGFSEFVFSSPEKKRLIKELAGALDLPCSMVVIKDGASPFADSMDDALQTINEEV